MSPHKNYFWKNFKKSQKVAQLGRHISTSKLFGNKRGTLAAAFGENVGEGMEERESIRIFLLGELNKIARVFLIFRCTF